MNILEEWQQIQEALEQAAQGQEYDLRVLDSIEAIDTKESN